jgi:hypothetical protein
MTLDLDFMVRVGFFSLTFLMSYSISITLPGLLRLSPVLQEYFDSTDILALKRLCHDINIEPSDIELNVNQSLRFLHFLKETPRPIEIIRQQIGKTVIRIHSTSRFFDLLTGVNSELLCFLKRIEIDYDCNEHDVDVHSKMLILLRNLVKKGANVMAKYFEGINYHEFVDSVSEFDRVLLLGYGEDEITEYLLDKHFHKIKYIRMNFEADERWLNILVKKHAEILLLLDTKNVPEIELEIEPIDWIGDLPEQKMKLFYEMVDLADYLSVYLISAEGISRIISLLSENRAKAQSYFEKIRYFYCEQVTNHDMKALNVLLKEYGSSLESVNLPECNIDFGYLLNLKDAVLSGDVIISSYLPYNLRELCLCGVPDFDTASITRFTNLEILDIVSPLVNVAASTPLTIFKKLTSLTAYSEKDIDLGLLPGSL